MAVVVAAIVIALAAAGVVLWGAAVIGVGQYAEDICLDDLVRRAGFGASRTDADVWPPSYECSLLGNEEKPFVVQHRSVALVRLGATVVLPVAYAVSATAGIVYWVRRRRFSNRDATSSGN
jgi:hypothetical protein